MGRSAARDHMEGTYSRLKKSVNRQAAFTLLTSMYDTGEMKVLERAPGHALLEWVGFALPTREVCETFTGYQAQRMETQGFEDVTVRHTQLPRRRVGLVPLGAVLEGSRHHLIGLRSPSARRALLRRLRPRSGRPSLGLALAGELLVKSPITSNADRCTGG